MESTNEPISLSDFSTEQLKRELAIREAVENGVNVELHNRGGSQPIGFELKNKSIEITSGLYFGRLTATEMLQLKVLIDLALESEDTW